MIRFIVLVVLFGVSLLVSCKQTPPADKAKIPPLVNSEQETAIPENIDKLKQAYPDFIIGGNTEELFWKDGTRMLYDDGLLKSPDSLLVYPDIEDMFAYSYPKGPLAAAPAKPQDPGRIRYEPFFRKMYGDSPEIVKAHLRPVNWLPSTLNQVIYVSKVNGVNEQLQQVSNILDQRPELHNYLKDIGGTFNWRMIAGTNRLSMHSFGVTIDINIGYSNYWRWEKTAEGFDLDYKNQIPYEIVEVFEQHGFIWGGKWYHYDTMHFEYRPELLL